MFCLLSSLNHGSLFCHVSTFNHISNIATCTVVENCLNEEYWEQLLVIMKTVLAMFWPSRTSPVDQLITVLLPFMVCITFSNECMMYIFKFWLVMYAQPAVVDSKLAWARWFVEVKSEKHFTIIPYIPSNMKHVYKSIPVISSCALGNLGCNKNCLSINIQYAYITWQTHTSLLSGDKAPSVSYKYM